MIAKIKSMKNLAVYKNFSWDTIMGNAYTFDAINIIYGRNYSGKTTLSRLFVAIETKSINEKYDSPQFELLFKDGTIITEENLTEHNLDVRVFNEDFVKRNLKFLDDPEGDIKPFAILGANVDIEQEIINLEQELGSNTLGEETGLYKEKVIIHRSVELAQRAFDKQTQDLEAQLRIKATDKKVGIKYNFELYGDQNYTITKLKDDIKVVLSPSYINISDEEKEELYVVLRESIRKPIQGQTFYSLNFEKLHSEVAMLISTNIASSNKIVELLQNEALNHWVKLGAELNRDSDICNFCGNYISSERWELINAHFDQASKELDASICTVQKSIESEILHIKESFELDLTLFYNKFHIDLMKIKENIQKYQQLYIQELEVLYRLLDEKRASITQSISIIPLVDYSKQIENELISYRTIIEKCNEFTKNIESTKVSAKKKLRLREVFDYCIVIAYNNIQSKIKAGEEEYKRQKQMSEDLLEQIGIKVALLEAKRRQLKDEEEGAKQVNRYLNDYFGHTFLSLQATETQETKKINFYIMRDGKIAYNLSEGEKSLIAFCYFIAKLNDIETKGKKPIIWIDDPISSLDSNHVYFVYSLIMAKVVTPIEFSQLFLSTHSLSFLKYLNRLNSYKLDERGKKVSLGKKYFLVERSGNESTIRELPKYLRESATEFNFLFSKIYECSEIKHINDENFQLRYNLPHYVRKFFEIYLYFLHPYNDGDPEKTIEKLKSFFDSDETANLVNRLMNEGAHGTLGNGIQINDVPESIPVAKRIIEQLSKNESQFKALLKSIGITREEG